MAQLRLSLRLAEHRIKEENMASGTIKNFANDSGTGYCKMPDGTLMCWGLLSDLSPRNLTGTQSGTLYYHEYTANVTFPIAFVNTPSISVTTLTGRECSISWVVANTTAFSSFDTLSGQQTAESTRKLRVSWIAIGRWK